MEGQEQQILSTTYRVGYDGRLIERVTQEKLIDTSAIGTGSVGKLGIATSKNVGLGPDYWAERCLHRIVSVASQSNPAIRDQALAFKDDIARVLHHYFREAAKSERTTIYNMLQKGGSADVAEHIRRL